MKKTLIVLTTAVFLTSCLKDKEYENGDIGHQVPNGKVIELARPNNTSNITSLALDFEDNEQVLNVVPARIAAATGASSDITVTLDTTVTSAYVASHPGILHFKQIAGASIVSPLSLTIPAGSLESQQIQIKVNPINFDPSSNYVVGFKITSVSDPNYQVTANYHTMYVILGAKNFFDGVYELDFTNFHPSLNAGYTGTTTEVYLVTTSANTCKIYFPVFAGFYGPAVLGGALTAFGSQEPAYTIDLATNAVTVQNAFPGAVTFYTMAPGFNSRYLPATKEIFAKFGYGAGYPPFNPAASREWTQHFTYLGPRP